MQTTRRNFLKTTGAAAVTLTAANYARARGANDRIAIGMIGCGSRGKHAHMTGINAHAKAQNVEFVAVCDPWKVAREEAAAMAKGWYGKDPMQFSSYKELLAQKDIDAVMIASCDHQHTTHLEAAVRAGKDVYVEKPLAKRLDRLKSACDAVKETGKVVQVGTQLRSWASFTGCKKLVQDGMFGRISRIEQCRNGDKPYWFSYVKPVKKEDVDWAEFLMDLPDRPFDSVTYSGWYGYRDFSDGPLPGLGSHFIDLVHYITGAQFPLSCVCTGGIFTWKDERNFTCPDQVEAVWVYPDFLVSYSTNFGNGAGNSFKLLAEKGLLDMQNWAEPFYTAEGGPKRDGAIRGQNKVEDVPMPDHFLDWLQCLRFRKTPNASIDAGYQHAVACLMGMQSFDTGLRTVYDPQKREIRAG